MKRFALGVLAAVLSVALFGGISNAAYVSLEGQGSDRTGVVRSEPDASSAGQGYQAEVMTLEGSVFVTTAKGERVVVSEGDTLITGDVVEVAEDARVDIAFDKDWKNVTRFEGGSKFTIKSVEPTVVNLPRGSVYARLKQLPKNSSFEVQTPTAVAAVRGSEYQVDVAEDGKTDVSNLSESPVYINGLDEKGVRSEAQTILKNAEFSQVIQPGARPITPRRMTPVELEKAGARRDNVLQRINKIKGEGRVGKIQDVGMINRVKEEKLAEPKEKLREGGAEGAIRGPQGEPLKKQESRNLGEPYSLEPRPMGGPDSIPPGSQGPFEVSGRPMSGESVGFAEQPGQKRPQAQKSEKPQPRKDGSQSAPRSQGPPK